MLSKHFHAVNSLRQTFYGKHFISDLAVRTEINIWDIFCWMAAMSSKLDLLQGAFSRSRLLGFGSVCAESGDKLLKLFDLLFFFLVVLPSSDGSEADLDSYQKS